MIVIGGGIGLRPGSADDTAFRRQLFHDARRAGFAALGWPAPMLATLLDSQFDLQARHLDAHHPGADRWIVEQAGRAVGRLDVDRTLPWWRLIDIALSAEVRGTGVGTALLTWLAEEAAKAGAAGVELHVAHDNPRAAALYERLGYLEAETDSATHRRLRRPIS